MHESSVPGADVRIWNESFLLREPDYLQEIFRQCIERKKPGLKPANPTAVIRGAEAPRSFRSTRP
jgi:hypothetical protein